MDYDTGKLYEGGTTLHNFALPAGKTPLFVGGSGIVIERAGQQIVARVYPLGRLAKESFLVPGSENETLIDVSTPNLRTAEVIDQTDRRAVSARWERFAFQFPIEGGHTYSVMAH
jgi:hypothetical protein